MAWLRNDECRWSGLLLHAKLMASDWLDTSGDRLCGMFIVQVSIRD